jgi:hypothetical protein
MSKIKISKQKKESKIAMGIIINAIIERFDDLEKETGANFHFAKGIVLGIASKYKIFD